MAAVNGQGGDLPSRLSGAGLLWRRLLNIEPDRLSQAPTPDLASAAPPLAPLDKNATSMRVLLHDTQANFEKFSTHVEKLLTGVSETKTEIKAANARFDRDRESMLGDIVDLVNRSQRELQKCIGTPAQTPALDAFSKELFQHISVIDQRLDSLHSLSHAHTQSLQAQVQATQLLLDKQGTIIAAVTPLLPLLQTLPLLIESVKTSLQDKLQTVCRAPSHHNQSSSSTVGKRQRTASPEASTRKRARQDIPPPSATETTGLLPGHSIESRSPPVKPLHKPSPNSISTSRVIESMRRSATHRSRPEQTPNQAHATRVDESHLPPVTPRRPLSELPVTRAPSRQPSIFPFGSTLPRATRPPSSRAQISPTLHRAPSKLPVLSTPRTTIGHSLHPETSGSIQRTASRASSYHPSTIQGINKEQSRPSISRLGPAVPASSPHQGAVTPTPGSVSVGGTTQQPFTSSSSVPNPATLRTTKDKRSPLKGRRFIPLLDSDDEGEED